MNTEGNNHEVRLEPRMSQTTGGTFSPEPVFGDAEWVAEHLEWIRRHYGRVGAPGEAVA